MTNSINGIQFDQLECLLLAILVISPRLYNTYANYKREAHLCQKILILTACQRVN